MNEIRCGSCRKLLMKAQQNAITGTIEIKCTRCGTLNNLRPVEPFSDRQERLTKA
ncbi:Com family DNA-binding transcriptional regulator [Labrenzia suaedae]|uniref:Com family DNA-binding transcriptional regulator n=2 Tax=Roseibium litorale TaxID=2803841 RepID=A0ABR9CJ71_9HYPH|nr:Com family DNA-binding transcriptional regulator [Roseibium litorale]